MQTHNTKVAKEAVVPKLTQVTYEQWCIKTKF